MQTQASIAADIVAGPINTIQQLWDAALAEFNAGIGDADAMMEIYPSLSARLTYQDVADVFSGVYIDTYWNLNLVDPALLAKSLVQGLGLDPATAQGYASQSVQQWRGPLVRKNINDSGSIPVTADFTASLDIVCNQDTPVRPVNLIANWNNVYWHTPALGKNYVYTRVQNAYFKGAITPLVQLFYTSGGVNQPPSSWVQCTTANNGATTGQVYDHLGNIAPLNVGDRGCSEAFLFSPTSPEHVCLIATMTTACFTKNNPQDKAPGNFNALQWITHNGAAAWHNVDPQRQVEDTLRFYNQDESAEEFNFSLLCQDVPVGSTIRMRSDDAALGFDTGDVTVTSSSQALARTVTLPPGYQGTLKIKLQDPAGACLPATARATFGMEWVVPVTHRQYSEVATLARAGRPAAPQTLHMNMGTFTLLGSGN